MHFFIDAVRDTRSWSRAFPIQLGEAKRCVAALSRCLRPRGLRSVARAGIFLALAVAAFTRPVTAQELPYTAGPVVRIEALRVPPEKFLQWWKYMNTNGRPLLEEAKKEGLMLSYNIYQSEIQSPTDANIFIYVAYPNMAAFDGMAEKMAKIYKKVSDETPEETAAKAGERNAFREVLSVRILREIKFK